MKSRAMTHRVFLLNPKKFLIVLLVFSLTVFLVQQKTTRQTKATFSVPAFPGAEGFGAESVGGRGGQVIEVTNLNDSGSGSLRACIDASGPRTCVFRTGGTITLYSKLIISNPYITIAGQTAPGGGIALKNDPSHSKYTIQVDTHDVIIRYIRVRPGPSRSTGSSTLRALTMVRSSSYNIVIDHCSFSWATDEQVSTWYTAHDITVQWSIISESPHCSSHSQGCHSRGPLFGSDGAYNISFHHSLMAHNLIRNPLIKTTGTVDVVNTVAYVRRDSLSSFWSAAMIHLDSYNNHPPVNFVGNYFKRGSGSQTNNWYIGLDGSHPDLEIFVQGNIGPNRPRDDMAENLVVQPGDRGSVVSKRHSAPPVTTYSCNSTTDCEAYDQVMANAGATIGLDSLGNSYLRRDAVDKRIVEEVRRGEGRIIDAPSAARCFGECSDCTSNVCLTSSDYTKYGIMDPLDFEGWPVLAAGTPYADSDHDGMADDWENLHGLDPNDSSDGPQDADGDGYTNIEEFLNGTDPRGGTPLPTPTPAPSPTPTPAPGAQVYEAEEATLTDARVESNHPGYTGSGFVNYLADSDASIRWVDVNVPSSGDYTLTFRYALGNTDRPVEIKVNGSIVESSLNFPNTGGWSSWRTLDLTTSLNGGTNTIEAVTMGYDGPNLDHLEVQPVQTQVFLPLVSRSSLP